MNNKDLFESIGKTKQNASLAAVSKDIMLLILNYLSINDLVLKPVLICRDFKFHVFNNLKLWENKSITISIFKIKQLKLSNNNISLLSSLTLYNTSTYEPTVDYKCNELLTKLPL